MAATAGTVCILASIASYFSREYRGLQFGRSNEG
jgi:hypothetical protein